MLDQQKYFNEKGILLKATVDTAFKFSPDAEKPRLLHRQPTVFGR